MKISGNTKAVKEIVNLIDSEFVPPFICRCDKYNGGAGAYILICEEVGDPFVIYDVTLENGKISHMKKLQRHSINIKDGCVN